LSDIEQPNDRHMESDILLYYINFIGYLIVYRKHARQESSLSVILLFLVMQ